MVVLLLLPTRTCIVLWMVWNGILIFMNVVVCAGQKFPTPTPGFGDRVFYETLLRQRPDSAMAQEW